MAVRIRHRDLIDVVRIRALGDLNIGDRADRVAGVQQLLPDLLRREGLGPRAVVRLVGVFLALQVRIVAAPDVDRVLGRAAVRREEVADDRLAVIGQVLAAGRVNGGVRCGRRPVGAQIDLTVGGVAQLIVLVVLAGAERKRAGAHSLRLLRLCRPVRIDLIGQHALHIILQPDIVYNSDAAAGCAAVDEIAVPLVALEPGQVAVRPDGKVVGTRRGSIKHRTRCGVADLEGIFNQPDGQLRVRDRLAAGKARAVHRTDRIARRALSIFQLGIGKAALPADRQSDAQRHIGIHRQGGHDAKAGDHCRCTQQQR